MPVDLTRPIRAMLILDYPGDPMGWRQDRVILSDIYIDRSSKDVVGELAFWRIQAKGCVQEIKTVGVDLAGNNLVPAVPPVAEKRPRDPVKSVEESLVSLREELAHAYERVVDETLSELPNQADIQKRMNRFYALQGLVRSGNELKRVLLDQEKHDDPSAD